jgi:hypothetical protein
VGLSMTERMAVTKQMARRYAVASKSDKGAMLDELCVLTGWTRRHARRALTGSDRGSPPKVRFSPGSVKGSPAGYCPRVTGPGSTVHPIKPA